MSRRRPEPMVPRLEDLESRRLLAIAGAPFALVTRLALVEHVAASHPSPVHDRVAQAVRAALQHRLDLAERHLAAADHRMGLNPRRTARGVGEAPRSPADARAVNYWTSVVHTYQHALGLDSGGAGAGQPLGVATPATVAAVTVDSTSGPTATEGGPPGVFTIHGSGVTVPINFQIAASGADTAFDDNLYRVALVSGAFSPITLTPGANGVMLGSVTIPSGQSSVAIKLVEGEDSSATEPAGTEQDTLTILPPSGGCCCCTGGSYAPGSPASATITLIDGDVTIQGPAGGAHATEGPPAVSQNFTIARTGSTSSPITVQLSTYGSTAVPGTTYSYSAVVAGTSTAVSVSLASASNSTTPSGSVVIPAGASAVTLKISPLDPIDTAATGTSQSVNLTVLDNSSCCCLGIGYGYGREAPYSATMTIDDPDGGTPVVTATPSPATAVEGVSDGIIDIKRSGDDGSLTVPFTLANVGGAAVGVSYSLSVVNTANYSLDPANGFVTFGDGTTDIYVHVTARDYPNEAPGKGVTLAIKSPPTGCGCGAGAPYALGSPYSATVTLTDAPVTVTGRALTPVEGRVFTGVVGTISDPDTAGSTADFTSTINWGDGGTSPGTIAGGGGSYTVSGTHTYAEESIPGVPYTVTVTVTDAGNTAAANGTATVADASLSSTGVTLTAVEGASAAATVAKFTDLDPAATATDFTATIDWGDGTDTYEPESGAITGPDSQGFFSVTDANLYTEEGTYTVTVHAPSGSSDGLAA